MQPSLSLRGLMAFAAALALLLFAPFARAQDTLLRPGGETGIGTLPIPTSPEVQALSGLVDRVCVETRVADAPTTIYRHLAGAPGVTITARQGNLMLVASSDPPGSEAATAGGTTITASWTSGGTLFTVTVTQGPNETLPDFTRRVDATVRAMQDIRPRDGAATGPHFGWAPRALPGPLICTPALGPPSEPLRPRLAA